MTRERDVARDRRARRESHRLCRAPRSVAPRALDRAVATWPADLHLEPSDVFYPTYSPKAALELDRLCRGGEKPGLSPAQLAACDAARRAGFANDVGPDALTTHHWATHWPSSAADDVDDVSVAEIIRNASATCGSGRDDPPQPRRRTTIHKDDAKQILYLFHFAGAPLVVLGVMISRARGFDWTYGA